MNTTLLKRFGWLRFSVCLGALALLCGWTQSAGAATLTVDKPDYQPGETVTLTGIGFGANDDVTVQVLHLLDIFDNNSSAAHLPWHVSAGANGGFVTSWVVPFGEDEEGVTLQATATGLPSGRSAIVIFTDAAALPGLAPVNPPVGGFRIEGDLQANTPTVGQGDWVPGPAGSGGNVLTSNGVPVNPVLTFHLLDLYNSGTDDNFAGGDKVDDNPSTWAWTRNPVGDKVDINNALLHITTDSGN
ncbi:MAG TPA: hypothetical protein VNM37_28340, partial [Candidatus Dormibacteraeota bacterium]|nr:hypothetical protein [Candidatus Dormibacteraeota bacterium]